MKIDSLTKPEKRILTTSCADVSSLERRDVENLFDLYNRYYAATEYAIFERDFFKKDKVILLKSEGRKIEGFSTLELTSEIVAGEEFRVLFSGDTIIDEAYWGTQALSRKFLEVTGEIYRQNADIPLYWLLIVKGHRTYRYLETFFNDYYPNHVEGKGEHLEALAVELAIRRYGSDFNPETGILKFQKPQGQLRAAWANIPEKDKKRLAVEYFLRKNPGYRDGDEMVCLCELSPTNFKVAFARRVFETGN